MTPAQYDELRELLIRGVEALEYIAGVIADEIEADDESDEALEADAMAAFRRDRSD